MTTSSPYSYHHKPVFLAFFFYAFGLGILFPRLGDLQLQLGLTEGILGLSLIGLPLGVQVALLFSETILRHITLRTVMIAGVAIISGCFVGASISNNPTQLFIWLFGAGLAVGVIEVAVNLEADRVEYGLGRRIMNRSHAFWSLGFVVSSILGALAAQFMIPLFIHFAVFGAAALCLTALYFTSYQQAPARPVDAEEQADVPRLARPTKAIMLLVGVTLSAMLAEGSAIDWSVIFMRDIFATPPLISGTALVLATFFQFFTRYYADQFVDRWGPYIITRFCLIILLIGVLSVVFSPVWPVALFGFACLGIGSSVIFPLAMSAAAQLTDRPAGVNVASLAQFSFVVFLLAPPLLGFVAEHAGIRYAYGLCLPLIVISFLCLPSLKQNKLS